MLQSLIILEQDQLVPFEILIVILALNTIRLQCLAYLVKLPHLFYFFIPFQRPLHQKRLLPTFLNTVFLP